MNYIKEYKKCINNFNYWLKHYIKFIEYNIDTSAEHFNRNEDIVRAIDINETIETEDKEPL